MIVDLIDQIGKVDIGSNNEERQRTPSTASLAPPVAAERAAEDDFDQQIRELVSAIPSLQQPEKVIQAGSLVW
jgi:hypothetical protein